MQHRNTLIDDNIQTLIQGIDLISAIDALIYSAPNHPFAQSSVGSHFRHCIDFYTCFITGIESGRINYDLRERDSAVESDRSAATSKIEGIIEELQRICAEDGNHELWVNSEGTADGAPRWGRSSVTRELQFLLSHTIHHYAIVAMSLRLRRIDPGEEFGVMPSTIRHWRSAQCAR